MRSIVTVLLAGFVVLLGGCSGTEETGKRAEPVADSELGLSKTDVGSTPDPIVATSSAGDPGENETAEAYFDGAPPSIPHQVGDFLPITAEDNMCASCHDLPGTAAKPREPGEATPMPHSHYTDLRRSPEEKGTEMVGARYVCTQCHAPQADAAPLVDSTYHQ